MAMRALKVTDRHLVYTCDPAVWGAWPHDLAAISAHRLGLKTIALQQGQLAVEKDPSDVRLQTNLGYYAAALNSGGRDENDDGPPDDH